MVYVIVIKYNEIYLFENFQVVLQDLLVAANVFFSHEAELDFGKRAGQWAAALHLK